MLIGFSTVIYTNYYGSVRNLKAANTVYEEARFVMERITKEIRNGTIDYEEYYNQNLFKNRFPGSYEVVKNSTYAQDYCQYSLQFYTAGNDGEIGTADDVSTGKLAEGVTPAIGKIVGIEAVPDPVQNGLYLININGDRRSYIQRTEKANPISTGEKIGAIGLLKLVGQDYGIDHIDATGDGCDPDPGENDGRIDTWLCEDGFLCESTFTSVGTCNGETDTIIYNPLNPDDSFGFLDITPSSLDIVDLKFFVSPMDDPRKAYNMDEIQIQPSVTIRLTARANPKLAMQFESGKVPSIVLESTVSARAYNEIITECNLKQCFPGTIKACPSNVGVCEGAIQECTDSFIWSGCTETIYQEKADTFNTIYEKGGESTSCDSIVDPIAKDTCKNEICSDDFDNNCNGFTDEEDLSCKSSLCNNGIRDEKIVDGATVYLEDCINVGGICQQIRPYQPSQEISCDDNYDNDCDGNADEFDYDCILQICNNGKQDKDFANYIKYTGPPSSKAADYIPNDSGLFDLDLDEETIDIGGICECFVDKEYDKFSDGVKEGRITGYDPDADPLPTGERLIKNATSVEEGEEIGNLLCYDGLDNDVDGFADELDEDCLATICNDKKQNCDMVPEGYSIPGYPDEDSTPAYLVNYTDNSCDNPGLSTTDEYCKNVGGICNNFRGTKEVDEIMYYIDHKKILKENEAIQLTAPTGTCTADDLTSCPLTSAANLCTDGLDNDCDEGQPEGGIDWEDRDCCPDLDNDGFKTKSATCVPPPPSEGGPAKLDCDDTSDQISPAKGEICDPEHPNIDNNCSFINGLTTNESDYNDPECCVDTDLDGFGVDTAWLSCSRSRITLKTDCKDTNKDINPDVQEDEAHNLCFNESGGFPVNDNCNTITFEDPENPGNDITSQRANHIDWYKEDPSNPNKVGIAKAYQYKLFEPACCDLTAIEICDDIFDSDENCNGLEGTDDNYCVSEDNKEFIDNLTTNAYISLDTGVVQNSETGVITLALATDKGNVTSGSLSSLLKLTSCTANYRVFFSPIPTVTTPGATTIRFQLSSDGGTTWCGDAGCTTIDTLDSDKGNDEYWIDMTEIATASVDFSAPNYQLRWRAELTGDTVDKVPVLDKVTITFACIP